MPSHCACACASVTSPPPTHSAETTITNPRRRMMPARTSRLRVRAWLELCPACFRGKGMTVLLRKNDIRIPFTYHN